jgi:Tol biopolymer transport system component
MAEPIVFISYARSDTTIDEQWLSKFRKHLQQALYDQTGGLNSHIEQEHLHVTWGSKWAEHMEEGPEQAIFLVPVITPGFFDDDACKEECEGFLQRETAMGRDDLIIPMYYETFAPMNDPSRLDDRRRRLVEQLNDHTPVEWRHMSGDPISASHVQAQVQEMARRIAEGVHRTPATDTAQTAAAAAAASASSSPSTVHTEKKKSSLDWVAVLLVTGFTLLFLLFGVQIYADESLLRGALDVPTPTFGVPRPANTPTPSPRLQVSSYNKLVFTSRRDGNQNIFVMDADGSNVNQLTDHEADDHSAAWSPDGRYIAFTSTRDDNQEIYLMNADGSNQRNLSGDAAGDIEPAWSPDGTRLAFVSDRKGNQNIYLMNQDGSNVEQLTSNQEDRNPAWSPDGSQIVFTSVVTETQDGVGNPDIYVIDVDGSNQRRMTNDELKDAEPVWMPNGRIAFVSWRDDDGEIYTMDADGSNLRQLTFESNNNDWDADHSPDGEQIVFTSTRNTPDGNKDIFVLDRNASETDEPRRLTDSPFDDYSPDWCCTGEFAR